MFESLNFFRWCKKKPIAHHLVAARVFLIGQVTSSDMKVPLTRMTEIEMASKQNSLV